MKDSTYRRWYLKPYGYSRSFKKKQINLIGMHPSGNHRRDRPVATTVRRPWHLLAAAMLPMSIKPLAQ